MTYEEAVRLAYANGSNPGYGAVGANGLADAYGTAFASPDRLGTYQNALSNFQQSGMASAQAAQVTPEMLQRAQALIASNPWDPRWYGKDPVAAAQQVALEEVQAPISAAYVGNRSDGLAAPPEGLTAENERIYQAFLDQLTPSQRAEYEQVTGAHFDKGNATKKGAMAVIMAAAGGLGAAGALGGAGAAAGAAEGAGALGAAEGAGAMSFPVYGGTMPVFSDIPGLMAAGAGGAIGGLEAGGYGYAPALSGSQLAGAQPELAYAGNALGGTDAATSAAWGNGAGLGGDTLGKIGTVAGGAASGGSGVGTSWLDSVLGTNTGISNGQLLNVGGNLLSGVMGSNAANSAADAQQQAASEANALQKYMYDTSRADLAPYRQAGTTALGQIQSLLANPGNITQDPGYQFGLDQGNKALNSGAASRGMTYSGAQGKALQRYGQDYGGTKLNESYNRLASIAGIGQQATNSGNLLGANYATQAGNNITDAGNSKASGYIGSNNAWTGAIGNMLNNYQDNSLYSQFLKSKFGD
jgi:hypothetical protein